MMNIYVGNLPYSVKNQELREAFEEFGEVEHLDVEVGIPHTTKLTMFLNVYRDLEDGDLFEALGYDRSYSLRQSAPVNAPADWRRVVSIDDGALTLSQPALIDVGAIGKGRLVDLVLDHLEGQKQGALTVDAGGDVRCSGVRERIGLEHPYDPTRIIGVVDLEDAALCASATNRRAWGDGLHHVLDARTGVPVRTVAATWAVAPTAMVADAAATALFFEGGAELAYRWGVEWVRMTTVGRIEWSPGFGTERCKAELFT